MRKTILRILLITVFVLAAQSCAAPGVPTADPNAISTAIIQTLTALAPTSGPGIPVTGEESPAPTATVEMPTATQPVSPTSPSISTATLPASPTPLILSTATEAVVTPGDMQVQVSVATNCRTGPGTTYQRVGALQVGEVADVVGRNAAGTYWVIRNPTRLGQTCWLWGQYATVSGNTNNLPVVTPPAPPATPTAAADFDVFYDGLERCTSSGWWVDINVENLGSFSFRSIALRVEDRDTDTVVSLNSNGFTNRNGCDETETREALPAGGDRTVSSPSFAYDPSGHRLRATITLCSDTGRNGTCVTQTVNFSP